MLGRSMTAPEALRHVARFCSQLWARYQPPVARRHFDIVSLSAWAEPVQVQSAS